MQKLYHYTLFIIEKFGGAKWMVEEMNIVNLGYSTHFTLRFPFDLIENPYILSQLYDLPFLNRTSLIPLI